MLGSRSRVSTLGRRVWGFLYLLWGLRLKPQGLLRLGLCEASVGLGFRV